MATVKPKLKTASDELQEVEFPIHTQNSSHLQWCGMLCLHALHAMPAATGAEAHARPDIGLMLQPSHRFIAQQP
jgi:hypothetical protein